MAIQVHTGTIVSEVIYSECGKHRYVLRKRFKSDNKKLNKGKLVFFLLNPSFADELLSDKANRIASNIAIKNDFSELVILNLFSVITHNSKCPLEKLSKDKFQENDFYIKKELETAEQIIISWGAECKYTRRKAVVKRVVRENFKNMKKVYSIKYKDNDTAHISYYISDNIENYEIIPYSVV